MAHLRRKGEEAIAVNTSGSACPCWNWRGVGYSKEWHRLYPNADDCNGTGLISSTPVSTTVKAFFYPVGLVESRGLPDSIKTVIGERTDVDLIMWGTAKDSDGSFFDLSGWEQREDYITYDSVNYRANKVFDLPESLGQCILLVKK